MIFAEFVPNFYHLLALIIGGAVSFGGAIYTPGQQTKILLLGIGAFLAYFAFRFGNELLAKAESDRHNYEQMQARADVETLVRLSGYYADLPPRQRLAIVQQAAPAYNFEAILDIPTLVIQENNADGNGATQYQWPEYLARREQWQKLAEDYFGKTHALPFRYYTENGMDRNKIFSVSQFREILEEIDRRKLGERDAQSREVSLFPVGETALRHFLPASPTAPPEFTPLKRG